MPLATKSRGAIYFLLLLFAFLVLAQHWNSVSLPAPQWEGRDVKYGLTIRNKGNQLVNDSKLLVFSPLPNSSYQRVKEIKASEPFEFETDRYANRALVFKVTVPPYGTKVITIDAAMEMSQVPAAEVLDDEEVFLRGEKFIEKDSAAVLAINSELAGDAPVTGRKVFDWIVKNVSDKGYTREDKGAAYAALERKGDCTEFSYLFIALMRLHGVPTRMMGGFVLNESRKVSGGAYHNWAEFYQDGYWHIADTHGKTLDANQSSYLAFRVIADDNHTSLSSSERFLAHHPDLEVSLE